jgi:lysyl-tRNA synthetase class I
MSQATGSQVLYEVVVGDTKGPQNARLAALIEDSVTRHAVTVFYKKPSRPSCLM